MTAVPPCHGPLRVTVRLIQVVSHGGHLRRVAQLAERLALDLSGALAGDPKLTSNLSQVALNPVSQSEPKLEHSTLLGAELVKHGPHLPLQEAMADLIVGGDRVRLFEVSRDLLVL